MKGIANRQAFSNAAGKLFEYKIIYKVKKFKNHQRFIDRQRPN